MAGLAGLAAGVGVAAFAWSSHSAASGRSLPPPHMLVDRFGYRPGHGPLLPAGGPATFHWSPLLTSVSTSGSDDAWIVGSVAWHWEGSRWRAVRLPRIGGQPSLAGVATIAADDAWAVGSTSAPDGEIVHTHPLVEHWNGMAWSVVPLSLGTPAALDAVSASSPDNVWASGWWEPPGLGRNQADAALRPLVAHWDGTAWHVMHVFEPWESEAAHVVALAADDVWVSGSTLSTHAFVAHWDGSRWAHIRAPFGIHDPASGITATSADDVWAVGSYGVKVNARTLAAHWDGHRWMIAPTPDRNSDSMLTAVAEISPTDVWAAGQRFDYRVIHNSPKCLVRRCTEMIGHGPWTFYAHWDGRRWSAAPAPGFASMDLADQQLGVAADGSAWAVGYCGSDNLVARWNGRAWLAMRHPPDIHWVSHTPARLRVLPRSTCAPARHVPKRAA